MVRARFGSFGAFGSLGSFAWCVPALFVALLGGARDARADDEPKNPWSQRPLSLKPLNAEFQTGLGFAQTQTASGQKAGTGANLEAAVGLPILGEVSVRTGYRFGDTGIRSRADYYARLFDHETSNLGNDAWANPEIRARGTLVDLELFALGLETRFVVPIANGSDFSAAPGAPVRIRIPKIARIDTGIFVPIDFTHDTQYTISIPAQLYIQVQNAFFGPMTGVRFNHGVVNGASANVTVHAARARPQVEC